MTINILISLKDTVKRMTVPIAGEALNDQLVLSSLAILHSLLSRFKTGFDLKKPLPFLISIIFFQLFFESNTFLILSQIIPRFFASSFIYPLFFPSPSIIYMMQAPKYQFTRKSRKPLSRDRKDGGLFQGNRLKSKESEDKRPGIQISPNKPHQLISNLRSELTNLKHQVAKLSKRDIRKANPNPSADVRAQYDSRSPRELKHIYSYYFQDVKSTLPQEESQPASEPTDDTQGSKARRRLKVESVDVLKQQILEVQVKNSELVKANEELSRRLKEMGERLKKQYQGKMHQLQVQRQRSSRQKENEESDRTINYQKQVLDNRKAAEQLKIKVDALTAENSRLKADMERYKGYYSELQQKQLTIIEKDGTIGEMSTKILAQKQEIEELAGCKEALMKMEAEKLQLQTSIRQYTAKIEEIKIRADGLAKKNSELQRKVLKLSQKHDIQSQPKRKSKSIRVQGPHDIRQLKEIIAMQEKSLLNQQSDINYLQSQLRKQGFLKHLSKGQTQIINSLNEEILRMHMGRLNHQLQQQ